MHCEGAALTSPLSVVTALLLCSTHVEILGNEPMLMDLLKVAAGQSEGIKDSIHTKIMDMASKIPWHEL